MTATVPHAEVGAQNAPRAIAPTIPMALTESTKKETAVGTKANETGTIAVVTLKTAVIHKTTRREFTLAVRGMDLRAKKSVIIAVESIFQQKNAKPASNAAEWDILGANVAADPSL